MVEIILLSGIFLALIWIALQLNSLHYSVKMLSLVRFEVKKDEIDKKSIQEKFDRLAELKKDGIDLYNGEFFNDFEQKMKEISEEKNEFFEL